MGVDPQVAIGSALFSQVFAGIVHGVYRGRVVFTRMGLSIIIVSSVSALLFSLISISLPPCVMKLLLVGLLFLFASTAVLRLRTNIDPKKASDSRYVLPAAFIVDAAKGVVGSGFSIILMLGQLILGVRVSSALQQP